MTLANLPPLVTVIGGSGFVGRYVVGALAKRGYRIRVVCRRPDLALFLDSMAGWCVLDPLTYDAPARSYTQAVAAAFTA